MTYTLCTKDQRCGKLDGHEGGCSGEPPPAEPTTAEAFDTLKGWLDLYGKHGTLVAGPQACLALLERRMQDSPSLAVLVEGFCSEVENAKFSRDARRSGGQTTGTVSPFEHVQPSVAMALERWARDFRDALKK